MNKWIRYLVDNVTNVDFKACFFVGDNIVEQKHGNSCIKDNVLEYISQV